MEDMETIIINTNQFRGAERYARLHNVTVKQLVEQYLGSFHSPASVKEGDNALLARMERLGGSLSGISDDKDERLGYLLGK